MSSLRNRYWAAAAWYCARGVSPPAGWSWRCSCCWINSLCKRRIWEGIELRGGSGSIYSSSESTFLRASVSDLPSLNPCSDYLCTHATIFPCCQAINELEEATKKQQLRPSLGKFSKLSLVQLSCYQQEWDLLNSLDLRSNFDMSSVIHNPGWWLPSWSCVWHAQETTWSCLVVWFFASWGNLGSSKEDPRNAEYNCEFGTVFLKITISLALSFPQQYQMQRST